MRVYGVELSYNNKDEVLQLPINPSSIEVSESGQGQTYDVVGLGEINVIKDRKLTEYSFSSFFPAQRYPFLTIFDGVKEEDKAEVELLSPSVFVETIVKWMGTKKPIRFIFTSDKYNINTPASIESFDWQEVAGSGGDIEYTITLKKYVFYAARKIEQTVISGGKVVQKASTPARSNEKQQPKTYKLAPGDTLWKVAQMSLGNGARWKDIQKLNGITDAEIKRLPVGKVLKLP